MTWDDGNDDEARTAEAAVQHEPLPPTPLHCYLHSPLTVLLFLYICPASSPLHCPALPAFYWTFMSISLAAHLHFIAHNLHVAYAQAQVRVALCVCLCECAWNLIWEAWHKNEMHNVMRKTINEPHNRLSPLCIWQSNIEVAQVGEGKGAGRRQASKCSPTHSQPLSFMHMLAPLRVNSSACRTNQRRETFYFLFRWADFHFSPAVVFPVTPAAPTPPAANTPPAAPTTPAAPTPSAAPSLACLLSTCPFDTQLQSCKLIMWLVLFLLLLSLPKMCQK